MVDYGTFCDEIEAAFTVRGLEQNPHIDVDRTVASFEDGLDDDDDNDAGGGDAALAMAKVREFALICAQRSVDPTPYLQDYDHNTNGCLAESVFMRVLATYVAGMDPQGDLQIMARHFRAAHSKGQATTRPDVDYRAFLVAVKAAQQQQQGTGNNNTSSSIFASTTSKQFRKATRTTTGSSAAATMSGSSTVVRKPVVAPRDIDVTQLLKELREFGARNGVRIKDFFAENDKHRQGHITVAKFRTAMAQLKMPDLDEFEVTALINAYPADGMASDRVDYRSFVADVEPVSYLEGDPDARPVAVTQSYYGRRLSGRTEGMIDEIHTNIRRVCSSFKIHLKPFFKDFDRNNSRKLLKTNFLKVLDNSKISDRARLSSEQLEALCKAHEVVNDRGVATGFINYYNFVKVVDPTTEKS
jgi:Ca2+-binding EF-hand superfamily protein